ncbi:molybdopterin binding domain [Thermosinus carboxydivorans Nor1]|uniref:Molybdopterin molybdenumtransferase n=1 Tax=Thermosinus carboxydivorans Nor1 TaxID=401526 RepID=A1HNW0_9FIRM|nr:molybdopterin-binding protein [Thermosinus carboxydivorans]EAX48462.1 molybdopterin binding domain [Thermosinus carboxydivorans Nor1]
MQLNLLEKTELRIFGLVLDNTNLSLAAEKVAEALAIPPASVLVVDVRPDHICLDILEKSLDMSQIAGKEQAILAKLATVPGLTVTADAYVDSSGIMGLIAFDEQQASELIARTEQLATEIEQAVLRRAIVFATGFEVKERMIEDTNSPYLMRFLTEQGYNVEFGGILDDDAVVIKRKIEDAIDRGFGLIITTGGVGAEDKDFSVEATTAIDPAAATPWIVKFQQGSGRHVKAGVRIGVGQCGIATIINLPGPHDEVVASSAVLRRYCRTGRIDKVALAEEIAQILRQKLSGKHWQHHTHQTSGEEDHGKNHHRTTS